MDWGCLGSAHDIKRYRLVRVATETADLKIEISGVEGVAKRRGRLGRSFVSKHALIPSLAGQPVSVLARFLCALGGSPDRRAVNAFVTWCPSRDNAL